MRSMKSRAEAAKLINEQLTARKIPPDKYGQWHYGKIELRALMDFIYGGPPSDEDQCIGEPLRLRNAKVGKWHP